MHLKWERNDDTDHNFNPFFHYDLDLLLTTLIVEFSLPYEHFRIEVWKNRFIRLIN